MSDTGAAGRALVRMPPRRAEVARAARKGSGMPPIPRMPERQLQELVRRTALLFGFHFYHTHNSRRSDPGFPDCVMLKGSALLGEPTRLVVAELKSSRGKVSAAQQGWLDRFRELPGAEVFVWYPRDWLDGTIERVLRG